MKTTLRVMTIVVFCFSGSVLNDFHYPNGGIFERAQRLPQRKPGQPHPFVDAAAWQTWIKEVQAGAAKNLAEEKQKAGATR